MMVLREWRSQEINLLTLPPSDGFPLLDCLAAWKLLPNVSQWVPQIIEKGYRIQFDSHPPRFNGILPTVVGPKQALIMEQEVIALLGKKAI